MKPSASRLLLPLLLATALAPVLRADPAPTPDALQIHQALRRLEVLGSVLYVAAHPDDENTRFLAHSARGRLLRTGYLSLNRGEGGQNLIGAEQGSLLGVIRTWELLKARQVDGAEQFFTRAVDFGYSKSPEESLAKWGREEILADMVRVIRLFRPDVIVTRFSETEGGHGHHLASAILAREAFAAAADPKRFPEQLSEPALKGRGTWQAKRLFWNAWRPQDRAPDPSLVGVDVGEFDARLGLSYAEIAALSRNNHKSQGFGTQPVRGTEVEKFRLTAGDSLRIFTGPDRLADLFEGVDLSWKRVKGGEAVGALVKRALDDFDFRQPGRSLPRILGIRAKLQALPPDPYVSLKLAETEALIAALVGLWVEASTGAPSVVAGGSFPLEVKVIARSLPGWTLEKVAFRGRTGTLRPDTALNAPLERNVPVTVKLRLAVPADHPETHPSWLEGALDSAGRDRYTAQDPALGWRPVDGAALEAELTLKQKYGATLVVRAPVEHVRLDKVRGEIFQPFPVTPAATVTFAEGALLFPDGNAREVVLAVRSEGDSARGEARLRLPPGWRSEPASRPFALTGRHAEEKLAFRVRPAAGTFRGRLGAELEVGGRVLDRAAAALGYEHIPALALFPRAGSEAARTDARAGRERVGYVMGAGDLVPSALRQLGYPVTLLGEGDLDGDLRRFDVIVTGVRAHNVRRDLALRRGRLMDWVAAGGRLIAQYDVSQGLLSEEIGPYPLKLSRDRMTVEEGPLTLLAPAHPFFTTPNRLGPEDFAGWVQERGLYFAGEWDARYAPLLEGGDPGGKPSRGILLVAPHGRGHFVYTGLSLFRQLPAGVPGAYRLLANLVSAKLPRGSAGAGPAPAAAADTAKTTAPGGAPGAR